MFVPSKGFPCRGAIPFVRPPHIGVRSGIVKVIMEDHKVNLLQYLLKLNLIIVCVLGEPSERLSAGLHFTRSPNVTVYEAYLPAIFLNKIYPKAPQKCIYGYTPCGHVVVDNINKYLTLTREITSFRL